MSDGSIALVTGGADSKIVISNPFNYSLLTQITTHSVRCLKWFGPNTTYLASGGADFVINIYETRTFTFVRRLTGHTGIVYSLDIMTNGSLFSGAADSLVKIWNPNNGQLIVTYIPLSASITSVKVVNTGMVAVVGDKKSMMFVDVETATGYTITVASGNALLNGALLYNNDQIFATAWGQKVSLIDANLYTSLRDISTVYSTKCLEYYPPCNLKF